MRADERKSSNTVFMVLILGSVGVQPRTLSDATWTLVFRINLVVLEIVECAIPILFCLGLPWCGVALDWGFHLGLGVVVCGSYTTHSN